MKKKYNTRFKYKKESTFIELKFLLSFNATNRKEMSTLSFIYVVWTPAAYGSVILIPEIPRSA